MDLTSQNPKNKMHLAWKLVFTHLYTPDAIIIIYMTFQCYCRKLKKCFDFEVVPFMVMRRKQK